VAELNHRAVKSNGITMHVVEAGSGPLVLLCHGFPECWYSWRHQLPALAQAGFHVVAPDQRGYGGTECPQAISAYSIFQLVGDMVGLVKGLGASRAVIAGHDWGAPVAWYSALLRPDIFRGLILLSVPYLPRSAMRPSELMRSLAGDKIFYQEYFQTPGKAESELDADAGKSIRAVLYSASGDAAPNERWRYFLERNQRLFDTVVVPEKLPAWLDERDIEFYATEFRRTGFRGGLNWYRNIDYNWEMTPFLDGAKPNQPALFIAGDKDPVIEFYRPAYETLENTLPNLRKKILLSGAGHWIQQERADEVNQLFVDFLNRL
jgi:pimeloyl-ACP methyl ester carboxylesterase